MKNKLWLLQIPVVVLFTFAFYIDEMGVQGKLNNAFLREVVLPGMRKITTYPLTNLKFRLRGPQPAKNKIIVAAIDEDSIQSEALGRWPWHRDVQAFVINSIFELGAKAVALDIVDSEVDERIHPELKKVLEQKGMGDLVPKYESDHDLMREIAQHADRLVLGWFSVDPCRPAYQKGECMPVHPDVVSTHPPRYEKFAFSEFNTPFGFDAATTPLLSMNYFTANLPEYNAVGKHAGSFNVEPDGDGNVRRMTMFLLANGKPYPGLSLELLRAGLGDDIRLTLNKDQMVDEISLVKSGRNIPVSPAGVMEINLRGPGRTYPQISVLDILSADPGTKGDPITGKFAGMNKKEVFKDAWVLVGPTATGIYDMRATPFDPNIPGVEIHANILDNLLSGDSLVNTSMAKGTYWVLLLMTAGGLAWAYAAAALGAVPALALFVLSFAGFGLIDLKVLFANNKNWNTSFMYFEMATIFATTLALKYIFEERDKRFVKGAFSKYVAPAVVDSILKDPSKLTVGGEKRELTIMFSDIRGFTSFSEKMDAKALAALLNDYLGIMTKIVFANEGTLDKYIGDAIMAFWGAPLDQSKHAANAIKTAIAMIKALDQHRPRFKEQYGVQVDIGVGVNSGMVNVGNMGSDTNFAYTVIGDNVNLASRLEGLTKAYGVTILTTRFTFNDIQSCGEALPPHRTLDHVKVKGKKNAVELIQVLDREMSAAGLQRFEEARQLYTQQKWDEAIVRFKEANEILAPSVEKMDGPSEVYIERCEEFKKNPPGDAWDGSWEMHSK